MKESKAFALLLLAPVIWGITFAFQAMISEELGAFTYNAIRTFIGFLVLIPFLINDLKHNNRTYLKKLVKSGFFCGLFLATASAFQQIGIADSTAGKAGFISSLYMLFVPLFSVFLNKPVRKKIWFCVAVAICGAYLLCVKEDFSITRGNTLIFICAFFFAIQIMVIDATGKDKNPISLTAVQFLFAALLDALVAICFEKFSIKGITDSIISILYSGILSCGVAYTLQTVGQKYVAPTKATLVLSLESTWAVIGGVVILGERMTIKELIGCILVFAAVVLSQIDFQGNLKKEVRR